MRAWTHTSRGDPATILSLASIPRPESVPENFVLIEVTHAAPQPDRNHID